MIDQTVTAAATARDTHHRPHVTSIRIIYGAGASKPKAGDRRTTKKHGPQVRVQRMACDWRGNPIGRIVSNCRPTFEWRSADDLDPWDHHLLTADERAAHAARPGALTSPANGHHAHPVRAA